MNDLRRYSGPASEWESERMGRTHGESEPEPSSPSGLEGGGGEGIRRVGESRGR